MDVGGVWKANFGVMEWGKERMRDKTNSYCPCAILWQGHKNFLHVQNKFQIKQQVGQLTREGQVKEQT